MPDKSFIIYKVTPTDMENLEQTKKEILGIKAGEVKDIQEEPIGFGIVTLKVGIIVNEKEKGAMEKTTKALEALKSVEEVEQIGMTLL
ncbi:MAG: elongation factor 1-beta [archaeon]|nr:elongation factor 1-beta [archaeon]